MVDFISLGGTCRVKVLTTSQSLNFQLLSTIFLVALATVIFSERFQFFCGRTHIVG